jgi:hypothetical protein
VLEKGVGTAHSTLEKLRSAVCLAWPGDEGLLMPFRQGLLPILIAWLAGNA